MLTRLYIDNFRCFEKFEWKPGRKVLILGRNGTGKSSLMDALSRIKRFTEAKERADLVFPWTERTRWADRPQQTFEMELLLAGARYVYRLVISPSDESRWHPRVEAESVRKDDHVIFEAGSGILEVPSPLVGVPFTYPHDPSRSAMSMTGAAAAQSLKPLTDWLTGTYCFGLAPASMKHQAEGEDYWPSPDLANFAAWYRHLVQAYPRENAAFLEDLRGSMSGFDVLWLKETGEDVRLLFAKFVQDGRSVDFRFAELSDGQRCLICLYAVTHFLVAKGGTVIIDEADNFISLREIEPWLMKIEDVADDHDGQVILISHHPEILDQWANPYGVEFVREGAGPVHVKKFQGDPEGTLTAAEVVAEGRDFD